MWVGVQSAYKDARLRIEDRGSTPSQKVNSRLGHLILHKGFEGV
jgi:hypothetical protein